MAKTLIPRKLLFGDPVAFDGVISPDGEWLSWIAPFEGVLNIWVAARGSPAEATPVTRTKGRPITWHGWSWDSRYVLFVNDENGDENSHVYAADVKNEELKDLTPLEGVSAQIMMASPGRPDEIVLGLNDRDKQWHDAWTVNISTGERRMLWENTQELADIRFDWNYQPRLATKTLADGSGRGFRIDDNTLHHWIDIPYADYLTTAPMRFNRPNTHLHAVSSLARNTNALYRIDWASGAQEMIAGSENADISEVLLDAQTFEIVAASADVHRQEWIYVADAVRPDLQRISEQFPNFEYYITSQSANDRHWVIQTYRAEEPAVYHHYNRDTGVIAEFAQARPALKPYTLAPMHCIDGRSRDGLLLTSYLTLPVSEKKQRPLKPLPMVLLVHGGPWARVAYNYSGYDQWLANRGYAVLSVNYRGSTGFGKAFIEASTGEHGRKMHDDLIDMVGWAIAEGIAQKDKIAIMGGSYGGYAAFLGATFTPDVFCCSVPIVGITNLQTLLESIPPYWAGFADFMYRSYGDPRTEDGRRWLAERSPIHKVDQVKIPMLILHGANDVRCKIAESDMFVAAMKARNIPGIYVVYPDEGHGFELPANRLSHIAIIEAFLAQHLGGRLESRGDDLVGSSHEVRWGAEQLARFVDA
jgi:dipeptidyl aminopeptidase/acylaminoacyl peptidase